MYIWSRIWQPGYRLRIDGSAHLRYGGNHPFGAARVNRPLADGQPSTEEKAAGGVATPVLAPDPPSAPPSDAGPRTTDRFCPRLELELEPVAVGSLVISPQVVRLLPEGLVRQHLAVPVRLDGEELVLA
ncbi:unnamed protein product, partial [marine sediment metagenome]